MARRRHKTAFSGIGGQAVLEGIMMKNKDKYAVAVRKANGEIEIDIDEYSGITRNRIIKKLPFVRGVVNFVDSLVLGMKTLNYSASFYEDEVETETKFDKAMNKIFKGKTERVMTGAVTAFSIIIAVCIFILLPYFLTSWLTEGARNESMVALIEGLIRIIIFLMYVFLISLSPDIKRVYCYHGAEHKCINCIEHGYPLNVKNVMKSSRLHRRCGTSFMLLVILISVILFFFIKVQSPVLRIVIRILLIPVIAGIAYEVLQLAGKSNNIFVRIISAPGLLVQKLTTSEPNEEMAEVAIAAVEAVFDWKSFLKEHFEYEEKTATIETETQDDNTK